MIHYKTSIARLSLIRDGLFNFQDYLNSKIKNNRYKLDSEDPQIKGAALMMDDYLQISLSIACSLFEKYTELLAKRNLPATKKLKLELYETKIIEQAMAYQMRTLDNDQLRNKVHMIRNELNEILVNLMKSPLWGQDKDHFLIDSSINE